MGELVNGSTGAGEGAPDCLGGLRVGQSVGASDTSASGAAVGARERWAVATSVRKKAESERLAI